MFLEKERVKGFKVISYSTILVLFVSNNHNFVSVMAISRAFVVVVDALNNNVVVFVSGSYSCIFPLN